MVAMISGGTLRMRAENDVRRGLQGMLGGWFRFRAAGQTC